MMNTEHQKFTVGGMAIEVVRKNIKHMHLGVYPPLGRVRIAAPIWVSDDALRLAIIDKLGWIKRQRLRFETQARQSQREMVNGESHYYLGRRYRLRVVATQGAPRVRIASATLLEMAVGGELNAAQRLDVLNRWYRSQLRQLVPPLLDKWQKKTQLTANDWRIKRMRTRWGTCSTNAQRIWLNLELAKKPIECLEYIIVHELVHLVERRHNDHFIQMMNMYMPRWRSHKELLNAGPLAHEDWEY